MKEKIEKYVGKEGFIGYIGVKVNVKILDIKERWGKLRYLVSPISGSGSMWVEHVAIPDLDIQVKEIK